MSKPRYLIFVVAAVLLIAGLACNFSNRVPQAETAPQQPAAPEVEAPQETGGESNEPAPAIEQAAPQPAAPEPVPTEVVVTIPIGIRQGLASLNSYRVMFNVVVNGPTTSDKNSMKTTYEYNSDLDAWHSHSESTQSSADDPEVSSESSDEYRIGNRSCSLPGDNDDGSSTIEELDPLEQEMTESLSGLVDMVISVENPVLVGEELVNGVQTKHFTFDVKGLGNTSGAEVTLSKGEYWVALDGQYLVKYSAIMETRNAPEGDPNAEVMYTEFTIELANINEPIQISMPAECK